MVINNFEQVDLSYGSPFSFSFVLDNNGLWKI